MTTPKQTVAATLTDVAATAGVSRATASRALGGYGAVSPAVRARVTAAAGQLGYRPNVVARNVRTGTTSTIGVVIADMSNPFFAQTTRGISDAARHHGYQVMVINTDENLETEKLSLELLLNTRVDGIVIAAADRTENQHLVKAQTEGFPLVLLDRRVAGIGSDLVVADNKTGARAAFTALVEAGHRRIAFISAAAPGSMEAPGGLSSISSSGADRIEVYLEVLHSLSGRGTRHPYLRLAGFDDGATYAATTELLGLSRRPTAIFASDSVIAIEALWAIRDAGLDIPRDISFVMGDDVPWSRATNPAISAVAQPAYDMGARTVDLLLERIKDNTRPPTHLVLPTEFHPRGSMAPPRN